MTPQHEDETTAGQRDAAEGSTAGGERDHAHASAPPGNPETDQEAVDKGEEQIGRVVGR